MVNVALSTQPPNSAASQCKWITPYYIDFTEITFKSQAKPIQVVYLLPHKEGQP